jgi:hypothetical protein
MVYAAEYIISNPLTKPNNDFEGDFSQLKILKKIIDNSGYMM